MTGFPAVPTRQVEDRLDVLKRAHRQRRQYRQHCAFSDPKIPVGTALPHLVVGGNGLNDSRALEALIDGVNSVRGHQMTLRFMV